MEVMKLVMQESKQTVVVELTFWIDSAKIVR